MKKVVALLLAVTIPLCCTVNCFAMSPAAVLGTAIEAAKNVYDVHVFSEIAGRCGSATPFGAKGNVLEVMLRDKSNLENIFNSNYSAKLTKSSQAVRADLVVRDSAGHNIQYIQCKAGLSDTAIRDTFECVNNGQYNFAKLAGSTESAAKYNEFAAAKGSGKLMMDTGISDEKISRIANKYHGKIDLGKSISAVTPTALAMGALSGAYTLVNDIVQHKDFYETFGDVTIDSITTFTTVEAAGLLIDITCTGLKALGVTSPISLILIPVAVAGGTIQIACYIFDKVVDEDAVKGQLADLLRDFGTDAVAFISNNVNIATTFVGGKFDQLTSAVESTVIPGITSWTSNAISSTGSFFKDKFSKIIKPDNNELIILPVGEQTALADSDHTLCEHEEYLCR